MRKLTLEEFQQRLKQVHPKEDLVAISYNGDRGHSEVKCSTCGTHYIKQGGYFLDKRKVSICKICFPTQPNTLKKTYQPPEGYELVGEYTGMQNKVLVKHLACGFIWEVKPNNLAFGKGCPKCNRKISKGEQAIIKWLEEHNINFITQYPIDIETHHLTIDFYLPEYDLYIEYNGEQHYHSVEYFGGEEKLKKQQQYDLLKQEFLKDKLLTISYLDFENIESILESSTTILNKEYTISD